MYFRLRSIVISILFSLSAGAIYAQKADPKNLLIRNVRTISNNSDTAAVMVDILIENNLLELVSTKPLKKPNNISALDAHGGYLLGNLKLNAPPKFIILDKDPRGKFNVWLDFESNMIFAIEDGVIHRNRLFKQDDDNGHRRYVSTKVKWFAYTPPPFALPVRYSDAKKWNYWQTKHFGGMFYAAVGLDRIFWPYQNQGSKDQIGTLSSNAGGEIRGLRLGSIGKLKFSKRPWAYTFFIATHAFDKGYEQQDLNSITLFDYRLDIPLNDHLVLSVGKQKEPISLERVSSSLFNQMQERVSDAFLPGRNFGVQISGNIFKKKSSWVAGVYNSWLDRPGGFQDNETVYMGRVTAAIYESGTNDVVHIGLTNRYSSGESGASYAIRPEFNKSIPFIETGFIETENMNILCPELSFLSGPFWVFSEYTFNQINTPDQGQLNFSSFHITGSWVLTGENRTYRYSNGTINPIPVANSVNQSGWGAWELAVRISSYDLDDEFISGGKMNIQSIGLNWWLTNSASFSFNVRYIQTDAVGMKGQTFGLNTRILLLLD